MSVAPYHRASCGRGRGYVAGEERARLAQQVSMAGILERGGAGGALHGLVSTDGILAKSRARQQAQARGDADSLSRHDFLFCKTDRASLAEQLQGAYYPQATECRRTRARLVPVDAQPPWSLSLPLPLPLHLHLHLPAKELRR